MHIGEIIHKLRKEKKMTLAELSDKSGVALATLSRIENGKMTGTLHSHMKISNALGIPLPDLYSDIAGFKRMAELKTGPGARNISIHNKSFSSEILVSNSDRKKMIPMLMRLNNGATINNPDVRSGAEQFIYVLNGKVEVGIIKEKYTLSKGDSIYFDSSAPHYFKNISPSETSLICVTSPTA